MTEGIIEHEFEISTRKGEMKKKLILVRHLTLPT
jgi:hypothetical protein